jgi:hypothetical protein
MEEPRSVSIEIQPLICQYPDARDLVWYAVSMTPTSIRALHYSINEAMGNIWPSNVLLRWGQLLSYRHPRLQLGLFLIADKVLSNTPVSHVVAQEAKQLAVIIHL